MSAGDAAGRRGEDRVLELRIAELDDDSLGRWRELGRRAAEPNPFAEADFLIPAAELIAGAPDRLVVVADAKRWLACIALASTRVRALTAANEVGLRQYGYLSTPLLRDDDPRRAAELLIAALASRGAYPLLLDRLGASGPFFEALEAALERGGVRALEREGYERAVLINDGGDWGAHLSRHHRHELRRQGRRLGEELGGELECRDRAGDPDTVERFLELELSGWKGRAGTAFACDPSHAEFFRRVCERFHAAGRLQLLELAGGGRPVALKCNLTAGEGSFAFKIAFDEQFSRWSPGIQLEVRNIELFGNSELRWMDSCAVPDNAMINRLWPQRRSVCTALLIDNSARARLAAPSIRLTRGLRSVKRLATRASPRSNSGAQARPRTAE